MGEPLAYDEPAPRPANILNVDEVELEQWEDRVTSAPLATTERSELAGLHLEQLAPGRRGSVPPSPGEEEVFVILEGSATLALWPSPRREAGARTEEIELRPATPSPGLRGLVCHMRSSRVGKV